MAGGRRPPRGQRPGEPHDRGDPRPAGQALQGTPAGRDARAEVGARSGQGSRRGYQRPGRCAGNGQGRPAAAPQRSLEPRVGGDHEPVHEREHVDRAFPASGVDIGAEHRLHSHHGDRRCRHHDAAVAVGEPGQPAGEPPALRTAQPGQQRQQRDREHQQDVQEPQVRGVEIDSARRPRPDARLQSCLMGRPPYAERAARAAGIGAGPNDLDERIGARARPGERGAAPEPGRWPVDA